MSHSQFDFSHLSPHERIELIDALWESLAVETWPITEEQKKELDSRMRAYEGGEMQSHPWEDVKRRLQIP